MKSWERLFRLNDDVELKRRTYILVAFSYVGSVIILLFAFRHLEDAPALRYILFSAATVILVNVNYFHWSRRLDLACYVASACIFVFVLAIVVDGAFLGTGLYWVFPFPLIITVFLGARLGGLTNTLLLLLLMYLLFLSDFSYADYRYEEKTRFAASLTTLMILSFIAEYYRASSHTEMASINEEKEKQANTDVLTGMPNRRFMEAIYLDRSRKNIDEYYPMVVVIADIDHFKSVNDTHGHDVGDRVLQQVSSILMSGVRNTDVAVRSGGEEFVVLYPKTDLGRGRNLAEKLRVSIESSPFREENLELPITMSFGVAVIADCSKVEEQFKAADKQLYEAKRRGRNRVC